ncbi:UDP-N-acetylmuramoyl-tripeptide--D-alanyl-D-alanine ligase [Dictyobacter alpinus]|uniref:UDP-N-acetylmuramoyl-tripeptide--D-alanyl-D-alanine ligase n=1 Tax=Dictyobacter alpinus TaxID=2014873 RepID=A0A402B895_9CHLR|nr:UDP-N-acetylmuramoyl-tripeptide--D-alanyl-D-alanine ligase [Dictyobacter alpinus]GCE27633.1 UDP-N-acetylmuramoyl-tripeptide--D-alanyl-D-alanine ligase [Dictyobacter alpinus]
MFTLNDILQGNADDVARPNLLSSTSPDPELVFRSAHHDSRQIEPGDLFIARKGANSDGHHFIPAAARAGALAALCSTPVNDVPPDFLQIIVPDILTALHATARARTQRQKDTIRIGITGSNGKTSTKDAVAAVLSHKASTLKTYASYNHELGYPITLLRLEPQYRYAVLEMGAQYVGELTWLCNSIASPHWSIITTVGAAHLEYFGTQERVAIAKSELVRVLTPDGFAILNYDDELVRTMAAKTQARILSYGTGEGATVRASNIGGDTLFGHSFTLHYHDQQRPVQLRLPGKHGITIALAAAAAGCAAEMSLDDIASALEDLLPAPGRCEIKTGPNNSILIDDSYNANRQSILAITSAMHNTSHYPNGKRWAILGDIFQLGTYARAEHSMCGSSLAGRVDYLIAIGDQARFYVEGAIAAGMPEKHTYYFSADVNNSAELETAKRAAADLLKHELRPDDLVLLKGSRGMQMETMLAML